MKTYQINVQENGPSNLAFFIEDPANPEGLVIPLLMIRKLINDRSPKEVRKAVKIIADAVIGAINNDEGCSCTAIWFDG